jgi:adenylate cyclase
MNLRQLSRDKTFEAELQREIEREVLQSERLRTGLLAGVFALLGILFTLGPLLVPEKFSIFGIAQLPRLQRWVALFFAAYMSYALFARSLYGYLLRHDKRVPLFGRYANAFIETSGPTLFIILLLQFLPEPSIVLNTPAPFAYLVFIVLSTLRLDTGLSLFTAGVAAAELGALVGALYSGQQSNAPAGPLLFQIGKVAMLLVVGATTAFVAWQIRLRLLQSFRLLHERNRITSIFGQHVSPAVVEALLQQKEQSESRHVCVMFLDIRNFTTFSEKRSAEEVVEYLNQIFSFCIEIINQNNGIINKFLGDGFMAVFGAPLSDGRDVRNAVQAARQIIERVAEAVEQGRLPQTSVGIGLHCGDAVTGNVGSATRKEYTVIGDVVNLASRIEQLNKQYGTQLLISEEVCHYCNDLATDFVAETMVKGRSEPVRIYRLA